MCWLTPWRDLAPGARIWRHGSGALDCARGHLIGIVNATPDSFSDEGRHFGTAASVAHGVALAEQGASVIEVGGESLRFSARTEVGEEIARVVPVIRELVGTIEVPVAIDTFKPAVAEAAIAVGASILNDPTGLRDPAMLRVAAAGEVGVVMTHFFGTPKIRPRSFPDVDVVEAVIGWAAMRVPRRSWRASGRIGSSSTLASGSASPHSRTSSCFTAYTSCGCLAARCSCRSRTRRCSAP